jgi:2,4-dienoyl-CoA reductase-like NADH-dependent reductase (Old Yellow Enzyme family)
LYPLSAAVASGSRVAGVGQASVIAYATMARVSDAGRPGAGARQAHLFSPLRVRDVELRSRVVVSPMCQYSSRDGLANDWHLVHLGSRAVGGAALVIAEASAIVPDGRISPWDLGIWSDAHADALRPVAAFVAAHGAIPGIQLAHAGRKASTGRPWEGRGPIAPERGGWEPIAPSARAYDDGWLTPRALNAAEIEAIPAQFAAAAQRALDAGFRWIELHAAHGYLLHEFLSPLSNDREDAWGGSWERRARLVLDVVRALRVTVREDVPLAVRLSATDWADGGWSDADTVRLAPLLGAAGADVVDCSSGGLTPAQQVAVAPGFQVPFAEAVRRASGMLTAAVGLITEPAQADEIVREGRADLVLLARELLRDPYWPLHAAQALGQPAPVPDQYLRAFPRDVRG